VPEEKGTETPEESKPPEESETPAVVETETEIETKSEAKSFDEGYVKDLRTESAKYRKRAQEAEAKIKEFEQEGMDELEKAQTVAKDATEKVGLLERQLNSERTRNAVTLAAAEMNFRDASDALSMIDTEALTYDDDTGRPTDKSIKGALKSLANQKPYLVDTGSGTADGGARGGAGELTEDQKVAGYEKKLQERYGSIPMPTNY